MLVTVRNVLHSVAPCLLTVPNMSFARKSNSGVKVSRSKTNRTKRENMRLGWKKIAEEATVDCYNEYEQISGWEAYLGDKMSLPCKCRVDRKEGTLIGFDTAKYGSVLLAIVKVDRNRYKVDATTVTILGKERSRYLEAFKKWL